MTAPPPSRSSSASTFGCPGSSSGSQSTWQRTRSSSMSSADMFTLPSLRQQRLAPKKSNDPCRALRLSPLQWGHPIIFKTSYQNVMEPTVQKARDPRWSTDLKRADKMQKDTTVKEARTSASVPGQQSPDLSSVISWHAAREER
eukprot:CAMPEP_0169078956 /NCGR_PEP_ID=MMETSP1015-20121227/9685_1 /TAXON_ID=342587 /ORGANISM="Karlodinium micrum, Strain CCMP2283" /LENGTH=143 /DNA_ID=CAMNT_0009138575 /DNA_START=46 /DNA_END=474 /DNA_ORIENTATION=+